ncbi:MAG: hypothetical protein GY822_01750 [Deltaproteobacteria bacterium]|nr:hypothetical protein [Deltaproteobacteria bacterium]
MDRTLLDGFRAGDSDALAELYEKHLRDVFVVVSQGFVLRKESTTRVPGLKDVAAQQDIVQDTFIRAFSATARKNYSGTTPGTRPASHRRSLHYTSINQDLDSLLAALLNTVPTKHK